jgi:aspartyl-tRNA(Asn)/glutamyl-tRNA(Gln) amidotransferase subunit A
MAQDVATTAGRVHSGTATAAETVEITLQAIESDPSLLAFTAVDGDRALDAARDLDRRIAAGESVGALAGVPIGVKDLEDAVGFVTTFGDPAHAADPPATRNSVEVERLVAAGAIVIGKTNTPAYGFHAETDNLVFGPTQNPWARHRTAGGSSGGSAAAVAAGLVPLCTGSDGGGSIRIPSAVCGLSGFKSTHGVVPMGDDGYGAWGAFSARGPMARTFADIAIGLDAVKGWCDRDLLSVEVGGSFTEAAARPSLDGMRIAWSPTLGWAKPDLAIVQACEHALAALEAQGAVVVETVESVFDERPVFAWWARASRGAWRAATVAGGPETFATRFLPDAVTAANFGATLTDIDALLEAEAGAHRAGIALARLFERCDVLMTPGMATIPPRHREPSPYGPAWAGDFTLAFNVTRSPASVTPIGFVPDDEGAALPIAIQMVMPRGADLRLMSFSAAVEATLGLVDRRAPGV